MTREDMIELMGNEDRADWAIDLVLASIKPEFVRAAIRVKREAAERLVKEREQGGYYAEGRKALDSLPEGFNLWNATPEQEAIYQIWEDRQREASGDKMTVTFLRNMEAAANTPHTIRK